MYWFVWVWVLAAACAALFMCLCIKHVDVFDFAAPKRLGRQTAIRFSQSLPELGK